MLTGLGAKDLITKVLLKFSSQFHTPIARGPMRLSSLTLVVQIEVIDGYDECNFGSWQSAPPLPARQNDRSVSSAGLETEFMRDHHAVSIDQETLTAADYNRSKSVWYWGLCGCVFRGAAIQGGADFLTARGRGG